jgi:hypothetical protein
VEEKVERGMNIDTACAGVAAAICNSEAKDLSEDEVRRIYFTVKKNDKAALKIDLARRNAEKS